MNRQRGFFQIPSARQLVFIAALAGIGLMFLVGLFVWAGWALFSRLTWVAA